MIKLRISLAEARRIALKSQRLQGPYGQGKDDALDVIKQLGYVQIDTLAVVTRAHHHTLWSRMKGYQVNLLDQLLREKKIFEYWSHAASYLAMSEYRYSLFCKNIYAGGKSHWFGQDPQVKRHVLERIASEGPLQSKDFEQSRKSICEWYAWKPAKRALEQLFMEGKLMVVERKGFQKVYNLTERVLPEGIDRTPPSDDEFAQHLVLKTIAAHGIATANEIGYQRGYAKEIIGKNIKRLIKDGRLCAIKVGDLEAAYFGCKGTCETLLKGETESEEVHILSPFDNALIQRNRLQALFDFDYMIECYVPESKRKYGYFCLPVLHGERFVARFDPRADRKKKTFYIHSFHAEEGWKSTEEFAQAFADKLKTFAAFNGCDRIIACEDMPEVIRKRVITP